MKKIISKILATSLICATVFSSVPFSKVSAQENNIKIINNSNDKKVVESSNGEFKYKCTNDKIDNNVTMEKFSEETGQLLLTVAVDRDTEEVIVTDALTGDQNVTSVSDIINNSGISTPEGQDTKSSDVDSLGTYSIMATTKNQNTYSNYEYTKTYGSPNVWELRRPDGSLTGTYYFKTKETSANKSDITAFYNDVEDINTIEGQIAAAVGLQVLCEGIAIALVAGTGGLGEPLAAYLTGLGFAGGAITLATQFGELCSDAEDCYFEVYYNSDVYF